MPSRPRPPVDCPTSNPSPSSSTAIRTEPSLFRAQAVTRVARERSTTLSSASCANRSMERSRSPGIEPSSSISAATSKPARSPHSSASERERGQPT
jgi:hypothetical protein